MVARNARSAVVRSGRSNTKRRMAPAGVTTVVLSYEVSKKIAHADMRQEGMDGRTGQCGRACE